MGDPRKLKNKYKTPIHPWEKLRLEAEKPLMKEYGLVNKKELWKISSKLKNFKDTAKKLVASKSEQALTEKKQMVDRMKSYGLISSDELDEILGLDVKQLLDRRFQTVVFKKGLARTIKQARQMIVHRHISVNGVKLTAPGYLVKLSEQDSISFNDGSKFDNESHPERFLTNDLSEKAKEDLKKKDEPEKSEEVKETSNKEEEKSEKTKEATKEKSNNKKEEEKSEEVKETSNKEETKKSEVDSKDKEEQKETTKKEEEKSEKVKESTEEKSDKEKKDNEPVKKVEE